MFYLKHKMPFVNALNTNIDRVTGLEQTCTLKLGYHAVLLLRRLVGEVILVENFLEGLQRGGVDASTVVVLRRPEKAFQ